MFKLNGQDCLYYKSAQGIAREVITVECIGYGEEGKSGIVSLKNNDAEIGCVQYCMVEKDNKKNTKI